MGRRLRMIRFCLEWLCVPPQSSGQRVYDTWQSLGIKTHQRPHAPRTLGFTAKDPLCAQTNPRVQEYLDTLIVVGFLCLSPYPTAPCSLRVYRYMAPKGVTWLPMCIEAYSYMDLLGVRPKRGTLKKCLQVWVAIGSSKTVMTFRGPSHFVY